MIHVADARKYYGRSRGIHQVTLDVKEGEIFGFVGPNGSGKTTLIRILLGLLELQDGHAFIMDKEVKLGSHFINQDIGYMPSESYFFNEMKVSGVLDFFQSMRKVNPEYLKLLIENLDIDLTKKFGALSFGNKKKIGIVVALMHQPKLLILDEPTSGLDPLIQSRFLDLLLEAKKNGTTILLSSHVLSEIEKVCDRVALIKEGVILFTKSMEDIRKDEHKRLMVTPNYQNLVLEGLSYINDFNGSSHYTYHGDVNLLINYLSQYKFKDVVLRNIGLEELFAVYYIKEDLS
ncbi:MAG: ABC transporter [Tenericutes bacterium HGW-Tenericutes-2]|jgi:ABC-2 type transport system ATP-binding protein|nr:MAG: ABC transporter [Tenericutes bacterium HGW-Tenericutes-2]